MSRRSSRELPGWAIELRDWRDHLVPKLTQAALAQTLGVSLDQVRRWEQGIEKPEGDEWIKLGKLAGHPSCWLFYARAGLYPEDFPQIVRELPWPTLGESLEVQIGAGKKAKRRRPGGSGEMVKADRAAEIWTLVPLLSDPAAAGAARHVRDQETEGHVPVPKDWVTDIKWTFCLRIAGDSMAPVLTDGTVLGVDASVRDPMRLLNRVVLVREQEGEECGVTFKWLRKFGNVIMLVPENRDYEQTPFDASKHQIIGRATFAMKRLD